MDKSTPVTDLLKRASCGDQEAKEQLYQLLYDELRASAHRVRRGRDDGDLQTTEIVNEVLLRFEKGSMLQHFANRRVFFAVAIRSMNHVLIDHFRRRAHSVDGPGHLATPLDAAIASIEAQTGFDFDKLHAALEDLANQAPRQHAAIMHRFYGGLTIPETAELLQVSESTVERDWRLARAKLMRRLKDEQR